MAEQKVDFVAIADHRQMRHFFLPEFDDTKFFYANEPEAVILGDVKFEKLHYNMKIYYKPKRQHSKDKAICPFRFSYYELDNNMALQ